MTGHDLAGFIRAAKLTDATGTPLALSPQLEQMTMAIDHAPANDLTDALLDHTLENLLDLW
jgi:hypothetical protein